MHSSASCDRHTGRPGQVFDPRSANHQHVPDLSRAQRVIGGPCGLCVSLRNIRVGDAVYSGVAGQPCRNGFLILGSSYAPDAHTSALAPTTVARRACLQDGIACSGPMPVNDRARDRPETPKDCARCLMDGLECHSTLSRTDLTAVPEDNAKGNCYGSGVAGSFSSPVRAGC